MAGGRAGTEKNRPAGFSCGLEPSGHLSRLGRIHSSIVLSCQEQDRRILCTLNNMMIWRICEHRLELIRILDSAELGDVEGAIWIKLHPKHVVDSDKRDHCPEQLRTLGQDRAHEQSSIAPALYCHS